MRLYFTILCLSTSMLFSGKLSASGQRSMEVTTERLAAYPVISLKSPPHKQLHYAGSSTGHHLLVLTRTRVSTRSDGRPGMPFDSTFAYTIASDELQIENGWDISELLKGDGINIRPRNCPTISLNPKQPKVILSDDPRIKGKCIPGETPGMEYY